jgi:hypothetical protein
MISQTARKPMALSDTQQVTRSTSKLANKKIWLPKLLYDALPYFYLTSGVAAFFATLYISEWFWVLPHYLLFSAACIHLGVLVHRRRHPRAPDASI